MSCLPVHTYARDKSKPFSRQEFFLLLDEHEEALQSYDEEGRTLLINVLLRKDFWQAPQS